MGEQQFRGIPKEEHDKLTRAAAVYGNLTGEKIDVGAIPVAEPERDAKAQAERAQRELETQAEVTRNIEKARQAERRLQQEQARGGSSEVQPENPGAGQPAMVTERARAQGVTRRGEEPPQAHPSGKK